MAVDGSRAARLSIRTWPPHSLRSQMSVRRDSSRGREVVLSGPCNKSLLTYRQIDRMQFSIKRLRGKSDGVLMMQLLRDRRRRRCEIRIALQLEPPAARFIREAQQTTDETGSFHAD